MIMIMIISFASSLITEILDLVDLELEQLSTYSPVEFFKTKIYISFVFSIIFSMPLWLISIYNFSKPGLTSNESNNIRFTFVGGLTLFILGCVVGLQFVAPRFLNFILSNNDLVVENLSVYETIKIIISTIIFTGLLISTPIITLLINRIVSNRNEIRKYIYTFILIIAIVATPKPSMILNLIFLLSFVFIAEITLFAVRRVNGS